jgi:hypothetical protein
MLRNVEESFMKQTCIWCSQEIGPGEKGGPRDGSNAHAVCGCCSEHFTLPPEGPLQKHLDSLPFPVFVVDLYAGVYPITTAVNKKACDWAKKGPREIIQHLYGNVVECVYARLPEGCGNTSTCMSCGLLQSVAITQESGEPQVKTAITLQRGDRDHPAPVALSITTMKTGRLVMLRMDCV